MIELNRIPVPKVEDLTIATEAAGPLRLSGSIATPEPNRTIGVYFRAVHDALSRARVTVFEIDVSGLLFVNSSAIRLFIDWAMWINQAPAEARYRLKFLTARNVTWQTTSITALSALAPGVVTFEASHGRPGS